MSGQGFSNVPSGYPQLAALAGRDKAFTIFRKFRTLNVRNLLYIQSELIDLESRLRDADARLDHKALRAWTNPAADKERKALFREIRRKLNLYNETLLRYEQIVNMASPTNDTVQILQHWLDNTGAISDSGARYLENDEIRSEWTRNKWFRFKREPRELAALDQDRPSPLAKWLRNNLLGAIFIEDLFTYGDEKPKQAIYFYPTSKIEKAVMLITVLFTTLLTLIPSVALQNETRQVVRFGLIGVFTILLSFLLALCGAKETEIITGTIGFAAVLIVFLSPDCGSSS